MWGGNLNWRETPDGKRRLWLNEHGICRDCGQRDVEPNTQLCFECSERKYKKAKEYYEKNKEKILEQTRQRSKMIYAERKEKGICVKCGKRQSVKDKTLCLDCYAKKKRKKDPRWNNEFPRSMRPELGLCYVCAKQLNKHKSLCDTCLEMGREKMKKINSNPTDGMIAQRERWKKDNDAAFSKSS